MIFFIFSFVFRLTKRLFEKVRIECFYHLNLISSFSIFIIPKKTCLLTDQIIYANMINHPLKWNKQNWRKINFSLLSQFYHFLSWKTSTHQPSYQPKIYSTKPMIAIAKVSVTPPTKKRMKASKYDMKKKWEERDVKVNKNHILINR